MAEEPAPTTLQEAEGVRLSRTEGGVRIERVEEAKPSEMSSEDWHYSVADEHYASVQAKRHDHLTDDPYSSKALAQQLQEVQNHIAHAFRDVGGVTGSQLHDTWVRANLPKKQIEEIRTLAETVFLDKAEATEWLQEPNVATYDRPPISLLGTPEGYDRVKQLLMRIEYGNLA